MTDLDHVDLVEDARLDSEGISDVEALADGEMVELLVATRTPAGRLVDWVDQALLVIHVGGISGDGVAADRLAKLRNLGLRTATDLVTAAADVPSPTGTVRDRSALNAVFGTEAELVMIVDSITTEPNFAFVSWWKTSPLGHPAGDRKLGDRRGRVPPGTPADGRPRRVRQHRPQRRSGRRNDHPDDARPEAASPREATRGLTARPPGRSTAPKSATTRRRRRAPGRGW